MTNRALRHQSRKFWVTSLLCAGALTAACGGGSEDSEQPNIKPDQTDAQTNPQPGTDSGTPVGSADTGAPITTSDAGVAPAVDAGPVDLGEDSKNDTFFRTDTLVLKAPNMYVDFFGMQDVTADGQKTLNDALTLDANADDFVDLSMLLRFIKTSDPKAANGQVTVGGAICPMPVGGTAACGPDKGFPFQVPNLAYTNAMQPCALAGTTEMSAAPCFSTGLSSLTMQLPILGAVPLQDGQVTGTYDAANISGGFVRGFLSKTVASATKLGQGVPSYLALFNVKMGDPLSKFFSAAQMGKNAKGEDGWWILMSYTAKAAKFDPAAKVP
jgi:hypothetical protein